MLSIQVPLPFPLQWLHHLMDYAVFHLITRIQNKHKVIIIAKINRFSIHQSNPLWTQFEKRKIKQFFLLYFVFSIKRKFFSTVFSLYCYQPSFSGTCMRMPSTPDKRRFFNHKNSVNNNNEQSTVWKRELTSEQ
jgi:hypothetical protein